jgi:hypothetical protein
MKKRENEGKKKMWLKDLSGDLKREEGEASATGEISSYMVRKGTLSTGNVRNKTKYICMFV